MAWWKYWQKPEPLLTPEEQEAVAEMRQAVQEVRDYIHQVSKLPRPVLEAWRDRLIEEEKRKNP
jgi:hypothetical protein